MSTPVTVDDPAQSRSDLGYTGQPGSHLLIAAADPTAAAVKKEARPAEETNDPGEVGPESMPGRLLEDDRHESG